jgi:hypothetical protein
MDAHDNPGKNKLTVGVSGCFAGDNEIISVCYRDEWGSTPLGGIDGNAVDATQRPCVVNRATGSFWDR